MKRIYSLHDRVVNLRYESIDYEAQPDEIELPFSDDLTDSINMMSVEQSRESMVASKVKIQQNLKSRGSLLQVLDFIDSQARDSDIVILWGSVTFHRLDPTLVWFCKEVLELDDLQIDEFFAS